MRRLVFACAVLVVLTGCGRAPTPIEPGRHKTPSPTAAATTGLTPPVLPKIAQRHDATGAANFVLYWVKVSNYAARTGDTALLRTISAPDCEGCNRYIDLYEKTYAAGGYFKGGDGSLQQVTSSADGPDVYISGDWLAAPGRYRRNSSAQEHRSNAESTAVTFLARRRDKTWIMIDVGLAAS
jgi:hypothetical protein